MKSSNRTLRLRSITYVGGPDPALRMRAAVVRRGPKRVRWTYVAGNRRALKALHYAIGRLLASRTNEIFEGPGYTVVYDRH